MRPFWLIGLAVPALMLLICLGAMLSGHRWRVPLLAGTTAGGAFCIAAWAVLRAALSRSDRAFEIVFLQFALSTAGIFVFAVGVMLGAKWQQGRRRDR